MALILENVGKTFENTGRATLKNINLEIQPGEFLCVVGKSGCGKSTLLNLIAGLEAPTEGRILLKGKEVKGPGSERTVMFQEHALFPWLNVIQNIKFGMKINGVPKEEQEIRAEKYLKMMQLEQYKDYAIHQLSGGMRQRVALARAFTMDSDILLMDEPFSALDGYLKDTLQKDMEDFLKQYQGDMIMVTHSRDEAFRFCKELMLLKDGRTLTFGETRRIFEQPGLIEAARLTGCKNNSRIRKLGSYEVEAIDWGIRLCTAREVTDEFTHIAIRGHWIRPAETDGQNCIPFEVQEYIETTFEHQYLIKCPDADSKAVLWWMRPKSNFQESSDFNLPAYLYLPPEHLMLLK